MRVRLSTEADFPDVPRGPRSLQTRDRAFQHTRLEACCVWNRSSGSPLSPSLEVDEAPLGYVTAKEIIAEPDMTEESRDRPSRLSLPDWASILVALRLRLRRSL